MIIILILQHRHALPMIAHQPMVEKLMIPSELATLVVDFHVAGGGQIRPVAERRLTEPGVRLHFRHVAVVHAETDEAAARAVAPGGDHFGFVGAVEGDGGGALFGRAELRFPAVVGWEWIC